MRVERAVGLGYKHDAAAVDTTKYAQYVNGSICANGICAQAVPLTLGAPAVAEEATHVWSRKSRKPEIRCGEVGIEQHG